MSRPPKPRWIVGPPIAAVFKPAGVPARALAWVTLALDEFEALRLVDREGLDQDQAAQRMGVSRPTVTRLLGRARAKVAQAICDGTALAIQGGPVLDASTLPRGAGPGCGRGRHGRRWCGGGRGRGGRGGPPEP